MTLESDLPRSSKNIWVLLAGSSLLKSKEFVGTELQKSAFQIISGVLYYRPNQKVDIKEELKKHKIEEVPAEFLEKMSVLLGVDFLQCYDLFCGYLTFEYKGTPQNITKMLSSEKNIKSLLNKLLKFYWSERLFNLLCLKLILSHWQRSSSHPYKELFRDFLESANESGKILENLISQFKLLTTCPVPSSATHSSYFTDDLVKKWQKNNLKEQSEVLQLLLLYFKHFEPKSQNIVQLLTLFQPKTQHLRHSIVPLFDNDVSLRKFIDFLKSLVIVECLGIDWLCKCIEQEISEHHLLTDTEALKELDFKISNLNTSLQNHGPIFLAWMLVRNWELSEFELSESAAAVRRFANNAIDLQVFLYFNNSLLLPETIALKNSIVYDLIYTTIGNLISVTFTLYDIEENSFLFNFLHDLCVNLFKNNQIANDFFKNGLDNGLGIIVRQTLDYFPFQTSSVLSFCCSLAETSSCRPIFEQLSILSNLTSYAETCTISQLVGVAVPKPNENELYLLVRDKILYNDNTLILKKNTTGSYKKANELPVIIWKDININGWKVLYYWYRRFIDLVIQGQSNAIGEEDIKEMAKVVTICYHLVGNNCFAHISMFNNLIELCFESFDIFSSFQYPPRILIAAVLNLSAALIKFQSKSAIQIWQRINEKNFLPYMIGLTTDLKQWVMGKDTFSSRLGDIIASEECIRGHYELCSSFLNLISEAVEKAELKNDHHLIAAVIYIINEVFPAFNDWNFTNSTDMTKISLFCFNIFHRILSGTEKSREHSKLEQICITSLMNGLAAEKLLNMIKHGKSIVKKVVVNSGSDLVLNSDDSVMIIRQSLSILSRLMVLNNSGAFNQGVIEKAFFSSQIKPNMFLVLSHYVFQRYDPRLARLAVILLRRLAKKIPMSLLACLGSEAESIREHFLFRLEEVTEDLHLKIALLDFLSTCAQHQPGLMEMFINVGENDEETTGCLQTVLQILQEKQEAKYFCPFELHCAALKFIFTFWLQPHLFAIDSLKKTKSVWTLITFPIFEDELNIKLSTFIFKILSREIFYIKTLERDNFHSDMEHLFLKLKEPNRLVKFSTKICGFVERSNSEENIVLLDSWREFLVSIAKYSPFTILDETKAQIVDNLISSFYEILLKTEINQKALKIFSDLILITFEKWKDSCINSVEDWNLRNFKILNVLNERKDEISFSVIISYQMFLTKYLLVVQKSNFEHLTLIDWISPVCSILNQNIRIIEKQLRTNSKADIELKLVVSSVLLLTEIIASTSKYTSSWLQILRAHVVIESLSFLLLFLVEHKIGLELVNPILYLLITMSMNNLGAESLFLCGTFEKLCLSFQTLYELKSPRKMIKSADMKNFWIYPFHLFLRIVICLLVLMKHHFVEFTITFIAVHLDHFCETLAKLTTMPFEEEVHETALIIKLLYELSYYDKSWRLHHKHSFEVLTTEVTKISKAVAGFLVRPNILAHIEQPLRVPDFSSAFLPKDFSKQLDDKLNTSQTKDSEIFAQLQISKSMHAVFSKIEKYSLALLQNIKRQQQE